MDLTQLDHVLERLASRYKVEHPGGVGQMVGVATALLGTLEGRGGNFPWKTLPTVLAHRGCILENYPDKILLPGERRLTLAKSKGIHDLTRRSQRSYGLTVSLSSLEKRPINSLHTRGRRMFANGRIDRLGLTRLHNTSHSTSGPTSSNSAQTPYVRRGTTGAALLEVEGDSATFASCWTQS
ncbi:hypothetical protein DFJ58DRAFT_720830 [Suillus subalutaceus]|uniref:uncharacterized protein n=1 Tax=Suillus subalutaceus TaxID=48586 RepID=UPI001B8852DC|nr:uncharacterized protein DFJ58DRAFT_720830 [Suillus subalutaceus]KAG1878082.1 hypothetical protein DFJ58DRAFT_720830 [Suillus subalutaceus]